MRGEVKRQVFYLTQFKSSFFQKTDRFDSTLTIYFGCLSDDAVILMKAENISI